MRRAFPFILYEYLLHQKTCIANKSIRYHFLYQVQHCYATLAAAETKLFHWGLVTNRTGRQIRRSKRENQYHLPRKQRTVWVLAYHDSIEQPWISLQSQDCSATDERAELSLPCQDKEILLLQERSGQERTQSAQLRLSCQKTKREVGHRCDRIQPVRTEAVSFAGSGFTQPLSGQLYNL